MRAASYRADPPDLLAAGEEAAKAASEAAKTCPNEQASCETFGIGVCTTLAAAGQRLLGLALADAGFAARIEYLAEPFFKNGKPADGHEYLMVTDAEGSEGSKVLVDFWYAAMEGGTGASVLPVADARKNEKWNLNNAKLVKDRGRERVYVVLASQQPAEAAVPGAGHVTTEEAAQPEQDSKVADDHVLTDEELTSQHALHEHFEQARSGERLRAAEQAELEAAAAVPAVVEIDEDL